MIEHNNSLFFSTGEFRFRDKAQDESSIFGKILQINLAKKETKLISMGHRNIQVLKFLEKKIF